MRPRFLLPGLVALIACSGGRVARTPPASTPAASPASPPPAPKESAQAPSTAPVVDETEALVARLSAIDDRVNEAIRDGKAPGCVVVVGRHDGVLFRRAYGLRSIAPTREPMQVDTVFDLASLTKPIATATSIMSLVERGAIALDAPVSRYVPEMARLGKGAITVRELLLHTAGLPPDTPLSSFDGGRATALRYVWDLPARAPGTRFVYSDVGYMVLAEIVRRVSGEDLATYARAHVFEPLGMRDTTFLPGDDLRARAAVTETRDGHWMQGEVHDPRAYKLGGVAGHAGLFSTADDLARYARALLGGGALDGARVLSPKTVATFIAPNDVPGGVRALGWDVRSAFSTNRGDALSPRAFGHGGFTGTSIWIDPDEDLFVIVLSNRVHPDGKGAINGVAARIANIAGEAVAPRDPVCATEVGGVRTGIDVLRAEGFRTLRGAHVGLITNATGRARDGASTAELLQHAPGVDLVALFAPEHGLASNAEGTIAGGSDDATGLPVYSLYGASFRPSAESLRGVDTLVVDLQDVGARFYTYAATMHRAMETAAERGLRFVVLDRPDPIGGLAVEGPMLDPSLLGFVNHHVLPVRHGLTLGELAELIDADAHLGVALHVVRMRGWRRDAYYDETGLPWVDPSPNLRAVREEVLYPGVALVEGTNVSVGRGTDTPFEVVGAPWIDADALAIELSREGLPGVVFEPVHFTPRADPYRGEACAGVHVAVTDRAAFLPVRTGVAIARALAVLHRDAWKSDKLVQMIGSARVVEGIVAGRPVAEIEAMWGDDLEAWRAKREKYVLYPSLPCAPAARGDERGF